MRKVIVLLFWSTGLLWADCVDGVRKMNPAERKMYDEAAAAIAAALPQAPESWKLTGSVKPSEPALCDGTPSGAFSIQNYANYRYLNPPRRRSYPEEAEIEKLGNELQELKRMPADVRKNYNDVMAQQSEKRRAARAAERDGKKEEAGKLYKEADEISKGADKIRADYLASIAPQVSEREAKIKELRSRVPDYTTEVAVTIVVNERQKVPAAGKSLSEEFYVWGSASAAKNGTNVQNVVLKITGWPDYREFIIGKIDQSQLSAMAK